MKKLLSVDQLTEFRNRVANERAAEDDIPTIVVSADTGAQASGVNDIIRLIKKNMLDRFLQQKLRLRITGCHGFCEMNPYVVVEPYGHFYPRLRREDVPKLIDAALGGYLDKDLAYRDAQTEKMYESADEIPFFKNQTRTIIGRNQTLDPIRILDYIANGGYRALGKVLAQNDPEWIIKEVQASGIRGRGGAGFPTGKKWEFARASAPGAQKYVVCNADEGDPGAYMDRGVLEGNPHSIIEGMTIAGIAMGATRGIIYVRSEYPLAIKHCLIATRQAREMGLLGENI
ncbi:MAG: NADH-quinone oxidoreductase subunit F, partial [Bacteroidetes bacterium]|nr:NADH-quinone oxidoreductase subunit F [Bacteroidota bacterium]